MTSTEIITFDPIEELFNPDDATGPDKPVTAVNNNCITFETKNLPKASESLTPLVTIHHNIFSESGWNNSIMGSILDNLISNYDKYTYTNLTNNKSDINENGTYREINNNIEILNIHGKAFKWNLEYDSRKNDSTGQLKNIENTDLFWGFNFTYLCRKKNHESFKLWFNSEELMASDHNPQNPIHSHSNGDGPHSHNSQEDVSSTILENGQLLVVYESYHGDSKNHEDSEHRHDSIYYRIYNYSYPNINLLDSFIDPYGDVDIITSEDTDKKWKAIDVDGLLVNKNFVRNQRDPSVASLENNYYVISWQSNHIKSQRYGIYYSIYNSSDHINPILKEKNATVEPDENNTDSNIDTFTNLFPTVKQLENNCFLIAWRYLEYDNMDDLNTVTTIIRGKIINYESGTITEGNTFDISDNTHYPVDYVWEQDMISISDYDETNKRIGITWLGENYKEIYCQFYTYDTNNQFNLSKINNNITIDTLVDDDNYVNVKRNANIILLNDYNYLITWGACKEANMIEIGGYSVPVPKFTYAKIIDYNNNKQKPTNANYKIINSSDDNTYNHCVDSYIKLCNEHIISCYALYSSEDSHTLSKQSDIYCSILDSDLETLKNFKVNTDRKYPDYKQSQPVITILNEANNEFIIQWESLKADEVDNEDTEISSDDDLYYRIIKFSVDEYDTSDPKYNPIFELSTILYTSIDSSSSTSSDSDRVIGTNILLLTPNSDDDNSTKTEIYSLNVINQNEVVGYDTDEYEIRSIYSTEHKVPLTGSVTNTRSISKYDSYGIFRNFDCMNLNFKTDMYGFDTYNLYFYPLVNFGNVEAYGGSTSITKKLWSEGTWTPDGGELFVTIIPYSSDTIYQTLGDNKNKYLGNPRLPLPSFKLDPYNIDLDESHVQADYNTVIIRMNGNPSINNDLVLDFETSLIRISPQGNISYQWTVPDGSGDQAGEIITETVQEFETTDGEIITTVDNETILIVDYKSNNSIGDDNFYNDYKKWGLGNYTFKIEEYKLDDYDFNNIHITGTLLIDEDDIDGDKYYNPSGPEPELESVNSYDIYLNDSYGDGWNGAEITIFNNDNTFGPYTINKYYHSDDLSSFIKNNVIIPNGTYTVKVTSGNYPGEVTWKINNNIGSSILSGTTPYSEIKVFYNGYIKLVNSYNIYLNDSQGDGWNGANLKIFNNDSTLGPYTINSINQSSYIENDVIIPNGIYTVEVTSGTSPDEITWNINSNIELNILSGKAPYSEQKVFYNSIIKSINSYDIYLHDSQGDGWDGAELTIFNNDYTFGPYTINESYYFGDQSSFIKSNVIIPNGTYTVKVTAGNSPDEITWNINSNMELNILSGTAQYSEQKVFYNSTIKSINSYDIYLDDSQGDGWDGAELTIFNNDYTFGPYTINESYYFGDQSSFIKSNVIIPNGTYTVKVTAGNSPDEITWNINSNMELNILSGTAPYLELKVFNNSTVV